LIERCLNCQLRDEDEPLHPESKNPTTFGLICAAAAVRFANGTRPFTIMSCDNLPHNGEVCKRHMTSAAEELGCAGLCAASLDEFVVWLQTQVKYPSTMVDRITPATSWEDIAARQQTEEVASAAAAATEKAAAAAATAEAAATADAQQQQRRHGRHLNP